MSVTFNTIGHCCVCTTVCMHVGGPYLCDRHSPTRAPAYDPMTHPTTAAIPAGWVGKTEFISDAELDVRLELAKATAEVATLTAERDRLREESARYPVPAFADDLHDFVADALRPCLQECGEEGDESWLVTAESAGDLADVALTALISAARLPGLADEHVMFEYNLARDQVARFAEKQLVLQSERDALAARLAQAERVVEAARAWRHRRLDSDAIHALLAAVDALDGTAGPGEEGGDG